MITLQRKADCCGCNACTQGCHLECISMQEDNEGFLYPKVDVEQCVDCGLCEKICPIINQTEARKPLHVYAAKNRNEEIRKQSSSGGIFTLLAEKIIEDGGVVFGARFDEKWEVMHDYTETKEGLAAFRGSKYLQSRTGNTFQQAKEFLKAGRKVLFSGTPCQIAGLKLFLRKEYDNLITIDFVCHGVPSPKVWRMYFLYLTDNQKYTTNYKGGYFAHTKAITEINFRDKTYGWKKFSLTVQIAMNPEIKTIQFRNKNKGWKKYYFYLRLDASASTESRSFTEPLDENIFMKGFLNDLYLRPSCHDCPSKSLKSGSDITLGDYWGIQNIFPDFDDDKGVSLVMINTLKAKEFCRGLHAEFVETSYNDAFRFNPSIEKSVKSNKNRLLFFQSIGKGNIIDVINKYSKKTLKELVRNCIIRILIKTHIVGIIKKLRNENRNIDTASDK